MNTQPIRFYVTTEGGKRFACYTGDWQPQDGYEMRADEAFPFQTFSRVMDEKRAEAKKLQTEADRLRNFACLAYEQHLQGGGL